MFSEFDIEQAIADLELVLDAYEREFPEDRKLTLLKKAVSLSHEIKTYFRNTDLPFNQILEIKLTAIDVFDAQIKLLKAKS